MQKLLCLIFIFFTTSLQAKNYYISAAGDNSDGLTPATAWQTIEKLNASFDLIEPGDAILFKCGETFYGSIVLGKNGTASVPIIISSFGTGNKPVISGFTTLTGWTNVGGSIWQCDAPVLKNNVNILTINNTPYAVGRTPNNTYYTYQSATTTQLTSSFFTGTPSYVGAEIVMKKARWRGEKARITSQSGSTVTYVPTGPIDNGLVLSPIKGIANYGFFLQRFPESLDQFGEWYFDTTARKMQLYSTVNPSVYDIKASYVDTVVKIADYAYIVISNLAIEGAGMYGVESNLGTSVTVKNCSFNNNTRAVYIWNTHDAVVDGNTFNNSFNAAILVSNNQRKRISITNNIVNNTGLLIGMGLFWSDLNLKAIIGRTDTSTAFNYVNIIGNTITNSGNTGIQFQGSNVTVRRNVIDNCQSVLDDAGGIYTFTNNSTLNTLNYRNRLIDSNFISNAIGAPDGANGVKDVGGYYLDDQASNITGLHNTIYNIPGNGVQMNTPHDNIFRDNTVYNTNFAVSVNKRFYAQAYNNVIRANVLYQKDSSQFNFFHTNDNINLPTPMTITQSLINIGNMDSNWITNLKYAGYQYYYSTNGSTYTFPPPATLATWRQSYMHDVISSLPPATVTQTNTTIVYNPSYTQKTISFIGESKIDPKGRVYDNSVTVPKWSSIILIDNGPASTANLSPVAIAGNSISITLPATSTTITGTGTDTDGTISSYNWVQLSGPTAATIVNPNSATTQVSNLALGMYQFELTVTDNNGAIGKDWAQVKVNQVPVANAGFDKLVTIPVNFVNLVATATDIDGVVSQFSWAQISGPTQATIVTPDVAVTDVINMVRGVYRFEVTATDPDGGIGKDIVQITVNEPPAVNAGPDKLISLPVTSVTLTGSATDIDGTITSYKWVKLSGPAPGTIATPNAATTVVNNLDYGIYQFELTATDNRTAPGKDTVQVIVNQPPVANAGTSQLISLPVNAVNLAGSGTDVDGTIVSYSWAKISGPGPGLIESPTEANTLVSNLDGGIYQFELTVTDNNNVTGKATVQVTVNRPPTANAGTGQIITLPVNTASLTGSGNDPDGTIVSFSWVKTSSPGQGTIADPDAPNTLLNNLVEGIYQFELTVTDNNGAPGKNTVTITVLPAPNLPPVANAGSNKLITLPNNTLTLTGSGTDEDGTISSFNWVKASGPDPCIIATPGAANTDLNDLVQGIYQFELTVTDNNGATGKATVQVTVNQAPVANAGTNQLISPPASSVTLSGSGTDGDGTVTSYAWAKTSGPASGTIASPNAATTIVSNLVPGVYQFELTVTDNNGATGKATVQVTVNQPPVANAGTNQLISPPASSVTLSGSGTDGDGAVTGYAWAKTSGPASGTIASPNAATTLVSNLVTGVYQFELTVTDNNGATGKATVQVTVNQAPVANAGTNQLISPPASSVTLSGSGTDGDGTVTGYAWAKTSGPASGTIASPNAATTLVSNLVTGVYQFELTVTDNNGAIGKATVQVTVNQPPVANAGTNQLISPPASSVTLSGSGTDGDGTVTGYAWAKTSGPASGTIASPNAATTLVSNLVPGVYQFELTVTDNNGATGKATVQVTVNQAPVANAGTNQLISPPASSVTLSGSGTDGDGTVTGYAWAKTSGPASGTIASPNAATTLVSNLVTGVYQFELTVTDNNGATGKATVQVTVNQAPVANAGTNQLISPPASSVTLSGSGTDGDGTVTGYAWAKTSGPASGTIASPNAATTLVSNLVTGVYQFELTVTDNNGAIGKATVQVTVNQPPVANAGTNQLISPPASSVTLSGSGTDGDGTVTGYAWAKTSGPASGTIASPNAATTLVSNLVPGVYQFELTVTDNNGATGKATVQVTVNQAPVANAGTNQLISPPASSVTLSGSGTDGDGTVTGYAWAKTSGPASGTIASPNAATTLVSNLVPGVYQFELTVTDNNGATGKATVQVTVNQAPVANAGTNQLISPPASSVTLSGSGTDGDGTVTSYAWAKTSGPASGTIASPNAATTLVSNLVTGVYQFELTVTDNNGATGKATVQVTVNQAPVANAGTNQLISPPASSVTLSGSGTDGDGSVTGYAWAKTSGPASGTIASPNAATTLVSNLVPGVYQFELTVTDNNGATGKATVQVTVNQAPVANAGTNQLISPPASSVTLSGSGTDGDGTVTSYAWAKTSGPASGTIASPNAATTLVSNLVPGVYQFELTVTDNNGATGKATVQVTVNQAPVANAGTNQLISPPASSVTLSGSGTDGDGTVTAWAKTSGPASGTIASPNAATTLVSNLVPGVYQFELTVTDNNGATGKATVQVTVNQAPVANAGTNQLISPPASSVTLTGSGTDGDGTVTSYAWAKTSGPASGTIASPNAATTLVSNLVPGVYQFELTVTDNNGATGKATVQVTVNQAPVANAGTDIVVLPPATSATLTGSGTDGDGTISTYAWVKISGPASGTIATPNSATTIVNSLAPGVYQFQLTVTDNRSATAKDTVQVTVNQAPVANAGTDKVVLPPTNNVVLTGSGTDSDGTVSSYLWAKISGPSSGTIVTPTAATTTVNSLVPGVYQYQLTVTDNRGSTGRDTVLVTVNQAPVANAGADKVVLPPTNSVVLTGSGTDSDGTISSYLWAKISGPSSGTIVTPTAATTTVNSLVPGVYQYQLTVTDNRGSTGRDTVLVTVNQAPVANAGADKVVLPPTNSVVLTGSGTDSDGTISSYLWAKISGPSSGTIVTPTAATTTVNSLVPGVYQYQLTVTDNRGSTGRDTVLVTVNQAPVANAGADKVVLPPTNSVVLTGSGTDSDGTISSYLWAKISGPSSGTIVTPTAATTTINSLVPGVYQYQLTVTDNRGSTGRDTVLVTVNQAPVANAGADKLIILPVNTTSLAGSGTDADGTISSYAWVKISGPTSGTISTPTAAATTLNSLVMGVYLYQLTVTDNRGTTGKDTVQVIVNQQPVANAGADKLVLPPASTVTLTGSGTDADGTISSYAWAKISGPTSGTIATPTAATTSLNSLVKGIYLYTLTLTDNRGTTGRDTVQVTVNRLPVANAGTDKVITLPVNTSSLSGTGTDPDGTISSYAWLKISGPATGTIVTPSAANTNLTSLVQGIYLFQLTVTDNTGSTGKDTVQVVVNRAPTVNTGADKVVNLPANSTSLSATATDADGTIASYAWAKLSGPASGTIVSPNAATTTVSGLSQGTYQYSITVTDNRGAIGRDTIQVIINRLPVANAGTDKMITLPVNTTTLNGSGTDPDGTISSYAWVKISGPSSGTITSPASASTTLNSLVQGVYQYQLTVTDNRGAIGRDTVRVTVNAAQLLITFSGTKKNIQQQVNHKYPIGRVCIYTEDIFRSYTLKSMRAGKNLLIVYYRMNIIDKIMCRRDGNYT